MQAKLCHRGLRLRGRFLGVEPFDLMLLVGWFTLWNRVFGQALWGLGATVVLALALRVLKLGRLPGAVPALAGYLFEHPHSAALGSDHVPPLPR